MDLPSFSVSSTKVETSGSVLDKLSALEGHLRQLAGELMLDHLLQPTQAKSLRMVGKHAEKHTTQVVHVLNLLTVLCGNMSPEDIALEIWREGFLWPNQIVNEIWPIKFRGIKSEYLYNPH